MFLARNHERGTWHCESKAQVRIETLECSKCPIKNCQKSKRRGSVIEFEGMDPETSRD